MLACSYTQHDLPTEDLGRFLPDCGDESSEKITPGDERSLREWSSGTRGSAGVAAAAAVREEAASAAPTGEKIWNDNSAATTRRPVTYQPYQLLPDCVFRSTYGLTLLGNANPWAGACGLRGGGCGREAGNVAWEALPKGEWMTPFRPPWTPFAFSWGSPAADAGSPLTVGREELLGWATAAAPSLTLRPRPFSRGWPKGAGLCCEGGVLWKEREELLRDGLPERSSWRKRREEKKRGGGVSISY